MRRISRPIPAAVITLALCLTACGSSDDGRARASDTTRRTTTTRATGSTPPTTARAGDPVIAAAGDIACPSDCAATQAVADLLVKGDYRAVLTLGDNQYEDGKTSEYARSYDRSWGKVKDITYPSPGNHDYHSNNAFGYFNYFGDRAGPKGRGYYSFDIGAWHLVSLNSEENFDAQLEWLNRDLAAHPAQCTLAYWHKPIWTSGNVHRDDGEEMRPIWRALVAHGADVVLNGHVHNYERFAPRDGIRQFIVGTGGRGSHYGFGDTVSLSEVRDSETDGLLELTLRATGYDWRFVPVAGDSFTDRGTGSCG
jgi:hypothetical protein